MQLPAPCYLCQMLSGQNALLQSFVNVFFFLSFYISRLFTDTHASGSLQDVFYIYIYIYIHIYYQRTICDFSLFLRIETITIRILKNDNVTQDHPPREWERNEGSSRQLLVLDPERVCLTCANGSGVKQVGWNVDEGKNTKQKGNVALEIAPLVFFLFFLAAFPSLSYN